jgi:hypothetical protein
MGRLIPKGKNMKFAMIVVGFTIGVLAFVLAIGEPCWGSCKGLQCHGEFGCAAPCVCAGWGPGGKPGVCS